MGLRQLGVILLQGGTGGLAHPGRSGSCSQWRFRARDLQIGPLLLEALCVLGLFVQALDCVRLLLVQLLLLGLGRGEALRSYAQSVRRVT